jgi:hypothetical protein
MDEKSAFEEAVTFKDVEELKKELTQQPLNQDSMIKMDNSEKLQLVQQSFDNMILFFR